jgi:CubicO group peptidase (beta-lactamase class C family)
MTSTSSSLSTAGSHHKELGAREGGADGPDEGTARFRYSGGGTTVVQQLLVDLEERPFPAIMEQTVLTPLGLAHSTFDQPPTVERSTTVAAAHDFDGTALPGKYKNYAPAAAAGLWTTPSDVGRFLAEIQLGLEGQSTVVSKSVATKMVTPVIAIGGGDTTLVALGTFVEKHGEATYFGHDGFGDGFTAMARASAFGGEGAVVMSNGLGAAPLLLEVLRSIAAEYGWEGWLAPPIDVVHVDQARLALLAGRYRSGPDESILIVVKGDTLELRQPFREATELVPTSDHDFVSRDDDTRFAFSGGEARPARLVKTPAAWPPKGWLRHSHAGPG